MDKGENTEKRSCQILKHTNIWEIVIIILIFMGIFYFGYFLWFIWGVGKESVKERIMTFNVETTFNNSDTGKVFLSKDQYEEMRQTLEEIQKYNDYNHENNLSVSTLNNFYASLFTAIAVLIAIIALIGWRSYQKQFEDYSSRLDVMREDIDKYFIEIQEQERKMKEDNNNYINQIKKQRTEMTEAIRKYLDLESKVDFLLKKKKHAEWVEKKFESKKTNSSNISFKLNLNDDEDQKTLENITDSVIAEHEETAWLEVIIAHELVSDPDSIDEEKLKDAEKIYQFNENRNLFKPNSAIEPYLYHFMGELYHTKFEKYQQKYNEAQLVDILEKSREYYYKSLKLRGENDQIQARSNLAVVLIDLVKLKIGHLNNNQVDLNPESTKKEIGNLLDEAENHLSFVEDKNPDFNTYWDQARATYYKSMAKIMDERQSEDIQTLLKKSVKMITYKKEKDIFLNRLKEELSELDGRGFPGNMELIQEIQGMLDDKALSERD